MDSLSSAQALNPNSIKLANNALNPTVLVAILPTKNALAA
jgi:hypothetical protein